MRCLVIGSQGITVCGGSGVLIRTVRLCPTCKQRRRFTGRDEAWYGITVTCCSCGDAWSSGERMTRPFKRGWRKDAAAKARKAWPDAVRMGSPEHKRAVYAEIGFEPAVEARDDRA